MSQIDISQWKEFKVGDILNITSSKHIYHARNLYIEDSKLNNKYYPYVVRTEFNNGIRGYIEEDRNTLNSGHTISLAQDTAQFFYQEEPYFTGNKIKICALSDDTVELTKNKALFLISALYKAFATFSYDSSFDVTRLNKVIIKLPVNKNGDPDWQYMDTYIAKLTALAHKNVRALKEAKAKPAKLNIDQWGEFKISDIYEHIEHPVARSKKHYESGNIPFIASGAVNNGIDCYLAPKNKQDIDKGNCLTISPVDGSCFYQPNDFLGRGGGGSAISILRTNKFLSQATHVFLASIISHTLKEQYSFGNMGNTQKIKDTIIKLPIDANNEPDWEYMDNQVRHLATISNLTIASLRSVI